MITILKNSLSGTQINNLIYPHVLRFTTDTPKGDGSCLVTFKEMDSGSGAIVSEIKINIYADANGEYIFNAGQVLRAFYDGRKRLIKTNALSWESKEYLYFHIKIEDGSTNTQNLGYYGIYFRSKDKKAFGLNSSINIIDEQNIGLPVIMYKKIMSKNLAFSDDMPINPVSVWFGDNTSVNISGFGNVTKNKGLHYFFNVWTLGDNPIEVKDANNVVLRSWEKQVIDCPDMEALYFLFSFNGGVYQFAKECELTHVLDKGKGRNVWDTTLDDEVFNKVYEAGEPYTIHTAVFKNLTDDEVELLEGLYRSDRVLVADYEAEFKPVQILNKSWEHEDDVIKRAFKITFKIYNKYGLQ